MSTADIADPAPVCNFHHGKSVPAGHTRHGGVENLKPCGLSPCQDNSGGQKTASFLDQTAVPSQLLKQNVGRCKSWRRLETYGKCGRQHQPAEAERQHKQQPEQKQDMSSVVSKQLVARDCVCGVQVGTKSGYLPGVNLTTDKNNSSLGNHAATSSPWSTFNNRPFCDTTGKTCPQFEQLLLAPDQIDMLMSLAVSDCPGCDIVGCCKQALKCGDPNKVLGNYLVAYRYRLHDVMAKILHVIRRNFLCVAQSQEFLCLPLEFALIFMEDSYLNVDNELDMFVTALTWVDFNKQERIPQAGRILKCVRYAYITPADIATYVEPNLHLFTGPDGAVALVNLYKYNVHTTCAEHFPGYEKQIPPRRGMLQSDGHSQIMSGSTNVPTEIRTSRRMSADAGNGKHKTPIKPQQDGMSSSRNDRTQPQQYEMSSSRNEKTQPQQDELSSSRNDRTQPQQDEMSSFRNDKPQQDEMSSFRNDRPQQDEFSSSRNDRIQPQQDEMSSSRNDRTRPRSKSKVSFDMNSSMTPTKKSKATSVLSSTSERDTDHISNKLTLNHGSDKNKSRTASTSFHQRGSRVVASECPTTGRVHPGSNRARLFSNMVDSQCQDRAKNVKSWNTIVKTQYLVDHVRPCCPATSTVYPPPLPAKAGYTPVWNKSYILNKESHQTTPEPDKQQIFHIVRARSGPVIDVTCPSSPSTPAR